MKIPILPLRLMLGAVAFTGLLGGAQPVTEAVAAQSTRAQEVKRRLDQLGVIPVEIVTLPTEYATVNPGGNVDVTVFADGPADDSGVFAEAYLVFSDQPLQVPDFEVSEESLFKAIAPDDRQKVKITKGSNKGDKLRFRTPNFPSGRFLNVVAEGRDDDGTYCYAVKTLRFR